MFLKLVIAALLGLACSCGAPCSPPAPWPPQEVCHPDDAGAIAAGAPFVLMATTTAGSSGCVVSVDGGRIELLLMPGSSACVGGTGGFAKPTVPQPVRCRMPALPEGSYTLNTLTPQSFTLPDAGLPRCP